MNLNEIKGIIEINGVSYDPKAVLQALLDQGMKIHTVNGALLVGRTFIDPSPNLHSDSTSCPIIDHCKIYEKLNLDSIIQQRYSADLTSGYSSQDIYSTVKAENKAYVDRIEVNDEDIDIQNLSSLFDEGIHHDASKKISPAIDSSEMIGFSQLTRYGSPTGIQSSKIPPNLRRTCPYCSSIANIKWKYCACCGNLMR